MSQPILFLMLGYPGAGKTTTSGMLARLTGATHVSSDLLRSELFEHPTFSQAEHDELYQKLDAQTETLLRAGTSVIYDANLNRYQHRQEKYDICARTGARPVLVWLRTPKEIAKSRTLDNLRRHLVPPDETPEGMFERIANVIEPPHADEPAIELDGTAMTLQKLTAALTDFI